MKHLAQQIKAHLGYITFKLQAILSISLSKSITNCGEGWSSGYVRHKRKLCTAEPDPIMTTPSSLA